MTRFILSTILLVASQIGFAQRDLMVYGFQNLPQSNLINPAFTPDGNVIIGLPAISNFQFQFSNSAFSYDKVIDSDNDQRVLNLNNFYNSLDDINSIEVNQEAQIAYLGIKINDQISFNFSASQVGRVSLTYPKTIFELLLKGNGNYIGETMSFDDLLVNATTYNSYNFGMNYAVNEKLSVGGRVKFLSGIANINTENFDLELYTDELTYDWTFSGNARINTAGITSADITYEDFLPQNGKNSGWGFDIGANYQINEKISVNAALNNVGAINWNSNVENYTFDLKSTTFSGIDLSGFVQEQIDTADNAVSVNSLETFRDSLTHNFGIDTLNENYKTKLVPRIYLGGRYEMFEKHHFTATLYAEFTESVNNYAISLGYQFYPLHKLGIGTCYTLYNQDVFNIGVGIYSQLGPIQIFAVSDDIFNSMRTIYGQEISGRVGLNLIIGNKSDKRKAKKAAKKTASDDESI